MAIPAYHVVTVTPRVITAGSNDLELNGLVFTRNPIVSASTGVLSFTSPETVGEYFGTTSDEYKFSVIYFTGPDNKFVAPRQLFFALRIEDAIPAWVRGARLPQTLTLAQLKAITDGAFIITVDSAVINVSGVDLSSATSFSDVATIIQTAIDTDDNGVTVTYSSLTGAYTITSSTTGDSSTITYADSPTTGTDLATLLRLREEDGAVLSKGSDALDIPGQMAETLDKTQNFVSFTSLWEDTIDDMLAYSAWSSANYGWLYQPWTTAETATVQDSDADPGSILLASGYEGKSIVYGDYQYAAFIMGVIASIAWERLNGTITAAFKKQAGLAAYVASKAEADVLEAKGYNYMGNFATRNAEYIFLFPGQMNGGAYGFIDPYINSIWLNNRLQVNLMDLLTTSTRVPYIPRGYNNIKTAMLDTIIAALNNGAIERGVVLSERQKSELFNEAGIDISATLWTAGFYIQVLDPGPTVRGRRESPIITLWYTYGGAVHRINVASTAVL